jgi:secretion/DNA translocation related TadE-like protein
MSERGAGSVLTVAAMALVVLVGLAVLAAAQVITGRARAIAAADAAALAAAPTTFPPLAWGRSPIAEALRVAEANGARLVSCICSQEATFEPRQVEVTVVLPIDLPMLGRRWVEASSAAEFVP